MTPHVSNAKKGWGTLQIDRQFKGVGQIKLASGTKDPAVLRDINAFLTTCKTGRLDLLIGLRDKLYTVPQLWTAFKTDGLDRLPTAETLQTIAKAGEKWLATLPAGEHKRKAKASIERLAALQAGGRVHDLAELLAQDRARSADRAVAFNRTRSHLSAFLRDVLGADHRLYKTLRAVQPLKPAKKARRTVGRPLEPAELEAVVAALGGAYAEAGRAMADTGMGPKELWEDGFEVLPDRVHILGEKRAGRDRFVPKLGQVPLPRVTRSAFEQRLKRIMKADRKRKEPLLPRVTPYSFRRTFSHSMEMAKIPRTYRRMYMGHGPADVTDLYEESEITAFLAQHAELLLAYLGRARQLGLRLA